METQEYDFSQTVLEARGITKRFPGVVANDNISLVIRGGEMHTLLAENGAGKTTLMNILAGKLVRLGHMGKASHPTYMATQWAVFEGTLNDLGVSLQLGAGAAAAMAALENWDDSGLTKEG